MNMPIKFTVVCCIVLLSQLWGCASSPPAVQTAVVQGNTQEVERLILDNPKSVTELFSGGRTLLHIAAAKDRVEAAQLLIDAGAELEAKDGSGRTPLLIAVSSKHPKVVDLLLNAGANVHATTTRGRMSLHHAAETNQFDIVELLLAAGADPSLQDNAGNTALHYQARYASADRLERLLKHGVSTGVRNSKGNTAFHHAVSSGHAKILPLLLNDQRIDERNHEGNTAVLIAIKRGHPELVKSLLKLGADPMALDKDGLPAHYLAAQYGFAEAMGYLLDAGAPASWQHTDGRTVLLTAAYAGHEAVIRLLMQQGIKPLQRTTFQEDIFATGMTHMIYGDLLAEKGDLDAALDAYDIARNNLTNVATQYEATSNEYGKRYRRSSMWDAVAQGLADGVANYAAQKQAQAQTKQMAQIMALSDAKTQQQYFSLNRKYQKALANSVAATPLPTSYRDPMQSTNTKVLKQGQVIYAKRAMRARSVARTVKYRQRCVRAGRTDLAACVKEA